MTEWLTIGIALGLAILLLAQVPAAVSFLRALRRRAAPVADDDLPQATVVLCLRGADDTLKSCLDGLSTQNYPRYNVVVVVDHADDPAWNMALELVEHLGQRRVRLEVLHQRRESCSLKCSSLVQAISGLDDSSRVIALLDADTVPHANWLRELVAPLATPGVGAAAGVRWYMPSRPEWGAIIRYLWNVPAIVFMYEYGIAWGGTLAFRREAFAQASLLEKWSLAYCEDTMTHAALKSAGLRLVYVPTLVTVHRDSCRLNGFFEWCVRQTLTSRLYHPAWWLIVVHGLLTTLAWIVPIGLAIWAAMTDRWLLASGACCALVAYWVVQWLALLVLERSVQRVVARRGEVVGWLSPLVLWHLFLGVPIAQQIYGAVLLATWQVRRVRWRGIWYDIYGPWNVRRGEYVPYSSMQNRDSEVRHPKTDV